MEKLDSKVDEKNRVCKKIALLAGLLTLIFYLIGLLLSPWID